MTRATVPYDMGWVCRGCEQPKLPGEPLCSFCQPQRGGSRSDPRTKVQVPNSGTATTEEEETMSKETQAESYTKHVALQVSRAVLYKQRLAKLVDDVHPWKEKSLIVAAQAAVGAVDKLIQAFEKLPTGWAPEKGKTYPRKPLVKGELVKIADKVREEYAKRFAGMLTAKDMDKAEVQVVAENGRVVVKTRGGLLIPVPRGHLQREESKEGTKSAEAK